MGEEERRKPRPWGSLSASRGDGIGRVGKKRVWESEAEILRASKNLPEICQDFSKFRPTQISSWIRWDRKDFHRSRVERQGYNSKTENQTQKATASRRHCSIPSSKADKPWLISRDENWTIKRHFNPSINHYYCNLFFWILSKILIVELDMHKISFLKPWED
jgi:hypothetical protein